jgi:hypothetical protein
MVGTPWQLFDQRTETLSTAPANSFAWEVRQLVPASKGAPKAVENADGPPEWYAQQRQAAENARLSPAQQATVAAARAAPSAQAALVIAAQLPMDIRYYTVGAVAFSHGDLRNAVLCFSTVIGQPQADGWRLVLADYMLARSLARSGDPPNAERVFAKTRARVAGGAPDPLGLAVASLGEEAKLHLDAGDIAGAIKLYAEQAADGSGEAVQSLRMVAADAMAHPERLAALVQDPMTQRLLVINALALAGDYLHALHSGGAEGDIGDDGFFPPDDLDLGPLRALVAAIQQSRVMAPQLDRLAALSYRLGDYAGAKALAEKATGPMASWVRAKLALQANDRAAAAKYYAQALSEAASDSGKGALEESSTTLLRGEMGTLTLVRGDFVRAMQVMWPVAGTYWGDVAYLAERVLTTDELKSFVDARVPPPAVWPDLEGPGPIQPVRQLRGLLARRLMRDGRYADAVGYFPPAAKDQPDARRDAVSFGKAIGRSRGAFWATDRAQAGWQAATLLRHSGMETMGTEIAPDQAAMGGDFDFGYGPGPDVLFKHAGDFVADERARYDASAPKPDKRFHYRYLAVDQALAAADEVPARSQAFAAILCQASGWMMETHDDRKARDIYLRYVANGAVVPFAKHFGEDCPDPDFTKISVTRQKIAKLEVRSIVHRDKWFIGAGGAALLAFVVFTVRNIRRRQT